MLGRRRGSLGLWRRSVVYHHARGDGYTVRYHGHAYSDHCYHAHAGSHRRAYSYPDSHAHRHSSTVTHRCANPYPGSYAHSRPSVPALRQVGCGR